MEEFLSGRKIFNAAIVMATGLFSMTIANAEHANSSMKISQFTLIKENSASWCKSLKETDFVLPIASKSDEEIYKLPGGDVIKISTHFKIDHPEYRQGTRFGQIVYPDHSTADVFANLIWHKHEGKYSSAKGVLLFTNWSDKAGNAKRDICAYKFNLNVQ